MQTGCHRVFDVRSNISLHFPLLLPSFCVLIPQWLAFVTSSACVSVLFAPASETKRTRTEPNRQQHGTPGQARPLPHTVVCSQRWCVESRGDHCEQAGVPLPSCALPASQGVGALAAPGHSTDGHACDRKEETTDERVGGVSQLTQCVSACALFDQRGGTLFLFSLAAPAYFFFPRPRIIWVHVQPSSVDFDALATSCVVGEQTGAAA